MYGNNIISLARPVTEVRWGVAGFWVVEDSAYTEDSARERRVRVCEREMVVTEGGGRGERDEEMRVRSNV